MITKTKAPYEFLIRWTDGKISGAHIKFLETVTEDGVTLVQKETNAEPVELAIEAGFPMADVWAMVSAGAASVGQQALTDIATANSKKAELEAATAQEIEDAKAREVAANEAKAAAEKAEAASKAAQEAASKAAADLEAENARVAAALAAKQAAEDAAKAKAAFDAAVAAAVAAQLAPVEVV